MSGSDRSYASVPERITWTTGFRLPVDKVVLGALSTFANFETGKGARVRVKALAARAHLHPRRVQRSLHYLEADHWIVAVRRQHKRATAWDINVAKLATTWVAMKAVGGVMPSFPQGDRILNDTSVAQLNDTAVAQLNDTAVVQDPSLNDTGVVQQPFLNDTSVAQLNDTSVAQIPCTERSPVQDRSPVHEEPALRAASPDHSEPPPPTDDAAPPQQLTFGPQDTRPPLTRNPNWKRLADTIRTALHETAERKKNHG